MGIERLTRTESLKNLIINIILNAVIAYYMFYGVSAIPMTGKDGFVVDLVATAFMLTFTFCYMVISIHSKNDKVINSSVPRSALYRVIRKLPQGPLSASCIATFAVISTFLPITLATLFFFDATSMSDTNYILFKALWGGTLGYVLTPVAIYNAKASMEKTDFFREA